ncbi:MAG: hypothetical protein H0T45_07495 [Pyrinomonadaceae bacterium]|nr:hypothetical protein [Pyrinomonadaceae bacterium]MDQ3135657.1 hypothetical protein [Acidobacteriota bacterium]
MIKFKRAAAMLKFAPTLSLAFVFALTNACRQSGPPADESAAPPRQLTEFEQDLNYARKGQFTHVYVFARKDGQKFQPEDNAYLKANSPEQTNMWIATEQGRRVIAGTNFDFTPEHVAALEQRFTIEDFTSK